NHPTGRGPPRRVKSRQSSTSSGCPTIARRLDAVPHCDLRHITRRSQNGSRWAAASLGLASCRRDVGLLAGLHSLPTRKTQICRQVTGCTSHTHVENKPPRSSP